MSEQFKIGEDGTAPQTAVRGETVKYGGLFQMPDSWEAYEGFASTYMQTKMVEAVREMECPEGKFLARVEVEVDGVTEYNHLKIKAVATYVDIEDLGLTKW